MSSCRNGWICLIQTTQASSLWKCTAINSGLNLILCKFSGSATVHNFHSKICAKLSLRIKSEKPIVSVINCSVEISKERYCRPLVNKPLTALRDGPWIIDVITPFSVPTKLAHTPRSWRTQKGRVNTSIVLPTGNSLSPKGALQPQRRKLVRCRTM